MKTVKVRTKKWNHSIDVEDAVVAKVGNNPETVARFLRECRYALGAHPGSTCFAFQGQHYRLLWRKRNRGPVVSIVDPARAIYWAPKGTRVTFGEGEQGQMTGRYSFSVDRFDRWDHRYEVTSGGERLWVAEPKKF